MSSQEAAEDKMRWREDLCHFGQWTVEGGTFYGKENMNRKIHLMGYKVKC